MYGTQAREANKGQIGELHSRHTKQVRTRQDNVRQGKTKQEPKDGRIHVKAYKKDQDRKTRTKDGGQG